MAYLMLQKNEFCMSFAGYVIVPMSKYSRPPPPRKFTVDHPFLYSILYEDKILFAGTYTN